MRPTVPRLVLESVLEVMYCDLVAAPRHRHRAVHTSYDVMVVTTSVVNRVVASLLEVVRAASGVPVGLLMLYLFY